MLRDKYYEYDLNENGKIVHYGSKPDDYSTDVLASKAVGFIEATNNIPFFMLIAPFAPHKEHGMYPIPAPRHFGNFRGLQLPKPPNFNELNVSDKPTSTRTLPILSQADINDLTIQFRRRNETLIAVDDMIGNFRSALVSRGILDNTIVILTSDNGYILGEHRWNGTKGVAYEGSIRVPLVMRGPGIPRSQTRAQLVANIDVTATILQWAGALVEHESKIDGRSFKSVLRDKYAAWRSALLTVRTSANKFRHFIAIRTARYKYAEYSKSNPLEAELYDLRVDPYEMKNQADNPTYSSALQVLKNTLQMLATCKGKSCWIK